MSAIIVNLDRLAKNNRTSLRQKINRIIRQYYQKKQKGNQSLTNYLKIENYNTKIEKKTVSKETKKKNQHLKALLLKYFVYQFPKCNLQT